MKAVKSAAGAPGENSPAAKKNPIRRLLLIEDNPADARLLREMLDDPDWRHSQLTHIDCLGEAAPYLEQNAADLILLDLGLHDVQGLAAVQRAHALAPRIPLVVLTGSDDESLAVQALKEGAQDYLVKGQLDARALQRSLRYAIERKNMEEDLFAEKERAQVTLNSIADAVICTDLGGNITFLNQVAERLTGWPWREAAGRPAVEVFRTIDAGSRRTARNPLAVEGGPDPAAPLAPNAVLIRRDGSEIPIEDSVAPIHDREGRTAGAVVVFRDASAARAMARQIAHSAEHDFLTGLPNRMLLNDRIRQAIAAAPRHMKKVALLFLDLDGFKHINDSLGHAAGDQLLQSIARRLVDCVRGSDTVSRQGGDEFVILLPEVEQAEDAAITARRLLQAVAEPQSAGMNELHVTASIGVSVYPDDGADAQTLIQNADTAMYQAKETGRHSYQFFKPAMNIRAMERQSSRRGCGARRSERN
jgi:diguanylate cyclase (GGDEF)-like protein/PAS domain S-box-containing protein